MIAEVAVRRNISYKEKIPSSYLLRVIGLTKNKSISNYNHTILILRSVNFLCRFNSENKTEID